MAKASKKARSIEMQAYDIAEKLMELPCEEDIESFGPKIIAIMKGVDRGVFWMLDERPGLFNYLKGRDGHERFYMLRRVRNSEMGREMFKGFK